jgi:hypothetical protein
MQSVIQDQQILDSFQANFHSLLNSLIANRNAGKWRLEYLDAPICGGHIIICRDERRIECTREIVLQHAREDSLDCLVADLLADVCAEQKGRANCQKLMSVAAERAAALGESGIASRLRRAVQSSQQHLARDAKQELPLNMADLQSLLAAVSHELDQLAAGVAHAHAEGFNPNGRKLADATERLIGAQRAVCEALKTLASCVGKPNDDPAVKAAEEQLDAAFHGLCPAWHPVRVASVEANKDPTCDKNVSIFASCALSLPTFLREQFLAAPEEPVDHAALPAFAKILGVPVEQLAWAPFRRFWLRTDWA